MSKTSIEEKYPSLFADCFDFSIGEGWYPLVESYCKLLLQDVLQAERNIAKAEYCIANGENPDVWNQIIGESKNIIAIHNARKDNPYIVQVKEKFGDLQIYTYNTTKEQDDVNRALLRLSRLICEYCGKPATVKTEGWIKNLCQTCANEFEARRDYSSDTRLDDALDNPIILNNYYGYATSPYGVDNIIVGKAIKINPKTNRVTLEVVKTSKYWKDTPKSSVKGSLLFPVDISKIKLDK